MRRDQRRLPGFHDDGKVKIASSGTRYQPKPPPSADVYTTEGLTAEEIANLPFIPMAPRQRSSSESHRPSPAPTPPLYETVTIQIGNSDNKLSQEQWSNFIRETRTIIEDFLCEIHFAGGSSYDAKWQNACFVAELNTLKRDQFCAELKQLRMQYNQDSVAVTFGPTLFV